MGGLVADANVQTIQTQLNLRFAPGEALDEMVVLQKEFSIFSSKHSLASASALLNVAPPMGKDRRGWFRFLNGLKRVKSDVAKQNGHDRIVNVLKRNLESRKPKPVFFTWHARGENSGVMVSTDLALSFSKTEYLKISAPTGRI